MPQSAALIRASATFSDLTLTQYASGLDWLRAIALLQGEGPQEMLVSDARNLSDAGLRQLLFERCISASQPLWLADADSLIPEPGELPQDALALADVLGLEDNVAFLALRRVHGRIDLQERARVGAAGEAALVCLLESEWPGSTNHVALTDDGFGYDVAVTVGGRSWHLEVKTTSRRGRLVLYLSRHEHEVGLRDPAWRLVVVGLTEDGHVGALATARHQVLQSRAPEDRGPAARWENVRHHVGPDDLDAGLPFFAASTLLILDPILIYGWAESSSRFSWAPS